MKRVFFALAGSAFLILISPVFAQDSGAAARAERMENDDRYRRMSDSVRQLISANTVLQNRVSALADDMRRLHSEVQAEKSRASANSNRYVTQDDLRSLAKKIREIDEKRLTDKKHIVEEIRNMLKTAGPVSAGRATPEDAVKPAKKPLKTNATKQKKK